MVGRSSQPIGTVGKILDVPRGSGSVQATGSAVTAESRAADLAGVRLTSSKRTKPRTLTLAETDRLTALFRASARTVAFDLPDLIDWMPAAGCRIGEALAARYGSNGDGASSLDLDAGTWEVNATVGVNVDDRRAGGLLAVLLARSRSSPSCPPSRP